MVVLCHVEGPERAEDATRVTSNSERLAAQKYAASRSELFGSTPASRVVCVKRVDVPGEWVRFLVSVVPVVTYVASELAQPGRKGPRPS